MKKKICLIFFNLCIIWYSYSQCEISGQVFYGNPLEKGVGATVREIETKTGVLVGADGFFVYSSNSSEKFTIRFSYEGMEPVDYEFDGGKYLEYKIRVNLVPKAKTFARQKKSYVNIKSKTKRPPAPEDKTPPIISVATVEEYSQISTINGQMSIYGTVNDESGIKDLSINAKEVLLNDKNGFQYTLQLVEGNNTIEIKATDNNRNKSEFTFYVKKEQPSHDNIRRAALIIGNADYKNSKLVNTLNDANDFGQKLQSFGFELYRYENIASKSGLEDSIINFCLKVQNYDLVLFYYSGHGIQVNNENYMVPTQATISSAEVVKSYCVSLNSVLYEIMGANCKYRIVILDACRDNPFEKNWTGKSLGKTGKGLAEISYSSNTLVMFATSPGSIASDNLAGRNGLFTQELLKNMDRDMTIDQIFKLTGKSVADISGNCQVPWISSSLFDDVYLKR